MILFAAVPAYASFKVYPGDFSLDNAKFSFVDTYKLSRSVEPALVYMDGSATLANGVLKLAMIPNEGISEGTVSCNFFRCNYVWSIHFCF